MEEPARLPRPTVERTARRRPPDVPEELLAACRAGDRQAFEGLFRLTADFVFSIALATVVDRTAAADVTQEVYLKLLFRIRRYDGRARFTTWLYRVTVNAALDHVRGRRPSVPVEEVPERELERPARPTPIERLERRETGLRLHRAVARLSDALREPLVLRFLLGLSYREIGRALALPPGTVASRLSRAQDTLAREWAQEERDRPPGRAEEEP